MGGNDATAVAEVVTEEALGFLENFVEGCFEAETVVILASVPQRYEHWEHLKSAETATEIGKILKDPLSSFPGMQQKSLLGITLVGDLV